MTTIGFVGLGVMGAPMARNLLRAGHDVVAYNRSQPALDAFVADGGRAATSAGDTADGTGVVVTMLPDSPDVEAVVLGDDGVLNRMAKDSLLIDCSSIRPSVSHAIAAAAEARGVDVLDAPVSGGQKGAVDATLAIMVGGTDEAFRHGLPVLEALGTTIVHVGPAASGQVVKAMNQLIVGGTIGLVAEAMVLLKAAGIDREPAVRVLNGGLAGSAVLERKSPLMLSGDFSPTFRASLHLKDMVIVSATAAELGIATPFADLVRSLFRQLVDAGMGDLDHAALYRLAGG
jgi:2-hydroxy-3-oxopropionate reductase